ncbi:MAG: hypothetical protein LBT52_05450 [Clostridiales Family XIII bacterium]|jgi:hypothetical protein|nr:hypothetical protein [Clostridiales Family XIII bacterium]
MAILVISAAVATATTVVVTITIVVTVTVAATAVVTAAIALAARVSRSHAFGFVFPEIMRDTLLFWFLLITVHFFSISIVFPSNIFFPSYRTAT